MGPNNEKPSEPQLPDVKRHDEKIMRSWEAAKAINDELIHLHSTKDPNVKFDMQGRVKGTGKELSIEGIARLAKKYPEFLRITDHIEKGPNNEKLGNWMDFVFEGPDGEIIPILSCDTLVANQDARVIVYSLLPKAIVGPEGKLNQTVNVTFRHKLAEEVTKQGEDAEMQKLEGDLKNP